MRKAEKIDDSWKPEKSENSENQKIPEKQKISGESEKAEKSEKQKISLYIEENETEDSHIMTVGEKQRRYRQNEIIRDESNGICKKIRMVNLTPERLERQIDKGIKRAFNTEAPVPQLSGKAEQRKNDIRRIVMNSLYWFNRPIVANADQAAQRTAQYFQRITITGQTPTYQSYCLALGTTRWTVQRWEKGESGDAALCAVVRKAKQILAALDAGLVSDGKIPQVVYIFRSKNYYGLQDVTITQLDKQDPLQAVSVQDLRRKYAILENPEQDYKK